MITFRIGKMVEGSLCPCFLPAEGYFPILSGKGGHRGDSGVTGGYLLTSIALTELVEMVEGIPKVKALQRLLRFP